VKGFKLSANREEYELIHPDASASSFGRGTEFKVKGNIIGFDIIP
jgi:hypothetical protein